MARLNAFGGASPVKEQFDGASGNQSPIKSKISRSPLKQTADAENRGQRRLGMGLEAGLLLPLRKTLSVDGNHETRTRASPKRKAKEDKRYNYEEEDTVDCDDSEWHCTDDSSDEDEEGDETLEVPGFSRPLFSRLKTPSSVIRTRERHTSVKKVPLQSIDLIELSEDDIAPRSKMITDSMFRKEAEISSAESSDIEPLATIRFSPPRVKSPVKTSPERRPVTPPHSPSKSTLSSPKKFVQIPQTPHRQSLDAFWDQDVVNTWNNQHSPRKVLNSARGLAVQPADHNSDQDNPIRIKPGSPQKIQSKSPAKSPVKTKSEKERRKEFEIQKHEIGNKFLEELDTEISGGEIQNLAEPTGGVKIVWSKKLNSTAGRANWRREAVKSQDAEGTVKSTTYRHIASIELAEKVIDDEPRLLNVLAHEYCHLANFMISHVRDQPHGASFQRWAAKATSAFGDRGVNVTTKHSYAISYKYAWACINTDSCGVEYARHSKSIDPQKHSCGKCKGKLVQIRPVPRKGREDKDGNKEGASAYQIFVKENFGAVKTELGPGSPMKDVMKELGARYRVEKEKKQSPVKKNACHAEEADASDSGPDGILDQVSRKLVFLSIRGEERKES